MITKREFYLILIFNFLIYLQQTSGSFCGESSIPFSFEASSTGQPILGCARPTCFGWTIDNKPASSPALFYKVNHKPDGYFRKTTNIQPNVISAKNFQNFRSQTAQCEKTYNSAQCPAEQNYWVGGIRPITNVLEQTLALQCCKYDVLNLSTDRGIAIVKPGQIVFGGEVLNNKRQYAFDYISDVSKIVNENGTFFYEVGVRRLPCLPYPPESVIKIEENVSADVVRSFSNKKKKSRSKAFQAQTFIGNGIIDGNIPPAGLLNSGAQSASENINIIEGPFVAETDAEIEEIQALNGFELPRGQVPQGIIEQPQIVARPPQFVAQPPQLVAQPPQLVAQPPQFVQSPIIQSSYGGGGYAAAGAGSGFYCFTADTKIQLSNGKTIRIDELKIGDWIMTEKNMHKSYSIVKNWIHRNPDLIAKFYRIELEDGKIVKLTGKHFIYKTKCSTEKVFKSINYKPVYAEDIYVGDCLYVSTQENDFEERRVQSVQIVEERGIYSPMTENGKIVVNDILASCFNVFDSPALQDTFFSYVKEFQSISGLKWLFGSNDKNNIDLPFGITLLVDLIYHILPNTIHSSINA